ncbi:MAG TPA: F0F1 ATP synthase subunit A [Clostridiales bacterium]|nr:F0F1 ATP synthase subunit A [Clostridiales bacterium]
MTKKRKAVVVWVCVILALLVGVFLTSPQGEKQESIKEVMRDAVMHDVNQISLFGVTDVNAGLISGVIVTSALLIVAALIRVFFIPKFQYIPGKFQLVLEQIVGFFADFAKKNSPHRHRFLSVYIFCAGSYIFVGTLFELLGVQAITTTGRPITLPAPLSDINGAIALGCLSYLIVVSGGILGNGAKGIGLALKDFSMPLSMSFRLFGALLSGVLVTELLYYYFVLSFGLPVVAGVLFTLLHALVQTYVLIMLTSSSYGEVSKPHKK